MNAQASWDTPSSREQPTTLLRRLWWGTIAYTLFVIAWGAVVRITGSGAGCGQHWPTCQGEIAPLPHSIEMAIEFSHRLTSGLSMLVLFACTAYTFVLLPRGHAARRAALVSCAFMILEAAIGARLVLLGLVGQNDTAPRAVIMALHLLNTSALLFAMLATLRLVSRPVGENLGLSWNGRQALFCLGALVLLVISAAGAITALGDTLYPVAPDGARVMAQASSVDAHFLERLRGFHPLVAVFGGAYLMVVAWRLPGATQHRAVLIWLLCLQLGAGVLNVALSAPGWMQVLHLTLANLLWLSWLWTWFERAGPRGVASRGSDGRPRGAQMTTS